jgi:hypothetical protein
MVAPNYENISQQMRDTVMSDGDNSVTKISPEELWDNYYTCLHDAYNVLRCTFEETGLTQDDLAGRLGVDKSLISKRLNGSENLTLKTMSFMGTGMGRYLLVSYLPYDQVGMTNYFTTTPLHTNTGTVATTTVSAAMNITGPGITNDISSGTRIITGSTGTNKSANSASFPVTPHLIGRVHG